MADRKRGRPMLPESERQRRKAERAKACGKSRIFIGRMISHWNLEKALKGFRTDVQMAEFLLNANQKYIGGPNIQHREKRQAPHVFHQRKHLRNVVTQTRRQNVSNQGTQSLLKQGDLEVVRRLFDLSEMNTSQIKLQSQKSDDVTEDVRWKSLKSSLGCQTNKEMSKILIDWFVNTSPLMKLSEEIPSEGESQATNLALSNMVKTSPSYHLILRVSEDQERAIRTMCLLKDWPLNPSQDKQYSEEEIVDFTRQPVPKSTILTPQKNRRRQKEPSVNRPTIPMKVSEQSVSDEVRPINLETNVSSDTGIPMDTQPISVLYTPETGSGSGLLIPRVKKDDASQPENTSSVMTYPANVTTSNVTSCEKTLPVVVKMEVPD